ncbi:hypothetical protein [Endozoicomonas arenosclerae]|uniref:hypothetical protein n=1 Tax=Endozoicomonas arenosclerae TaxID=1633495 RepID=UPI000784CAC6|nr:hypothetical protein [Endozoicomonas arenosclerae]
MNVGSEGTGRKPPQLSPSSDLPKEAQGVRKEEATRKQVLSRSEHKPFRSLAERGIETVPVKPGLLTRALSSLSSSFISFFSSAISSVAGASQKEIRDLISEEHDNQKQIKLDVKEFEASLKRTDKALQNLRKSMEALTPEQMEEYSDLVREQQRTREQLVLKRAYLTRSAEQVRSYEQALAASKSKQSLSMKVLEENISTGIQALMVLKDVFNKNKKGKHQGKVFEMRLGDVKVADPDRYDFQAKNLVVNVGRFCFEDGHLELEIPEVSANCFSLGEGKAVGPIKMKGGCRVRIGEPLAEPLNKLLTCGKTEIFGAYKKVSEAFDALYAETSGLDAEKHLGDVIQFSVDGLETEEGSVTSDLFSEAMGEAVIRLLSPVVTTWKKEQGAESLKKSREREDGFTVKAKGMAALCQLREKTVKMLEEDLPRMQEGEGKKECQVMLTDYRQNLDRTQTLLKERENELSKQEKHTAAMLYRASNAGKSVQSYQNALKLFHTLRGVVRGQLSGQPASASMAFSEQRIDFTDTAHAELSSASLQLSGFSLDEEGVLEIKVPDVSLNLGLVNEVSDTREEFPTSLKDVSLKVSPPMGAIVHEILLLDFPLEFKTLELLWKKYQDCTSEHYSRHGAHDPVDVASYFSVDVGSVACLAEGDIRIEAGDRSIKDKELMVLAVSRLMGQELKVTELDQLFRKEMGMNPQSSGQIMNLLCLGLLGEPDEEDSVTVMEPEMLEVSDPLLDTVTARVEEPFTNPVTFVDSPVKDSVGELSVSTSPEPFVMQEPLEPVIPTSNRTPDEVRVDDEEGERNSLENSALDPLPLTVSDSLEVDNEVLPSLQSDSETLSPAIVQKGLATGVIPSSLPGEVEITPRVNEQEDIRSESPQVQKETPVSPSSSTRVQSDSRSEGKGGHKKLVFKKRQEAGEKPALSKKEIRVAQLSHCQGVSQVKTAVKDDRLEVSFAVKAPTLKVLGKLPFLLGWLVGSDLSLSVQSPLKEDVVQFSQPSIQVRGARVPLLGTWLANYWLKRAMTKGQLGIDTSQVEGRSGLHFVRNETV